jgi:hypothetical protein
MRAKSDKPARFLPLFANFFSQREKVEYNSFESRRLSS